MQTKLDYSLVGREKAAESDDRPDDTFVAPARHWREAVSQARQTEAPPHQHFRTLWQECTTFPVQCSTAAKT